MKSIEIKGRRYGYRKRFMDQMEAYIQEHPAEKIIWPSSVWPKSAKRIYDGSSINRTVHDWDDPWYVPIEWIIANPEKYAKFLENKRKILEVWNKDFNIKMPNITGKVIITSLIDTGEAMYQTIWDDSNPSETGLKRFFIPEYKKQVDDFGNELEP